VAYRVHDIASAGLCIAHCKAGSSGTYFASTNCVIRATGLVSRARSLSKPHGFEPLARSDSSVSTL